MMQDRKLIPIPTDEMTSSSPVNLIQNRWALLVGIDRYVDPAFSPLKFCVKDVLALNTILEQLGYTIACLHDKLDQRDARFPTFSNVEAELTRLCQTVGPDDLLWVHFACHGTLIDKQPVLIAENSRHATLASTALPLAKIENLMRGSKAKRLVLTLDACHTGVEMGRDLSDPTFIKNAFELAEGFALIAASTAQQVAQEWGKVKHGVFTYYLLEGLTGKADYASKGFVTVKDLQTYVVDNLRKWSIENKGQIQEPTFRADGIGDMILGDHRQYGRPQVVGNPSEQDDEIPHRDLLLDYRFMVEKLICESCGKSERIDPDCAELLEQARETLGLSPEQTKPIEEKIIKNYFDKKQEVNEKVERYQKQIKRAIQDKIFPSDEDRDGYIKNMQGVIKIENQPAAVASNKLGKDLIKEEELEKAYAYFQKSICLNGDDPSAYVDIGTILYKQRNFKEALVVLNIAERLYQFHHPKLKEEHQRLKLVIEHISKRKWQNIFANFLEKFLR